MVPLTNSIVLDCHEFQVQRTDGYNSHNCWRNGEGERAGALVERMQPKKRDVS